MNKINLSALALATTLVSVTVLVEAFKAYGVLGVVITMVSMLLIFVTSNKVVDK